MQKQQQNILQNMVSSRKKDVGLRLIDEIDKLQNQLIEFNNTISNGDKESIFTPLLSNYYDALKLCGYTAFDSGRDTPYCSFNIVIDDFLKLNIS